jgi:hypothetical protein
MKKKLKKMFSFLIIFLSINAYAGIFVKEHIKIHPNEKISEALKDLSDITGKYYVLESEDKILPKPYKYELKKVFNLETLNKYLIEHNFPYLLKVINTDDNKYILKLVRYSTLNDYYAKGIRLTEGLTINQALKELSKQNYPNYSYIGENFKIPANPNVIIKNVQQLKEYLDNCSYKTIEISKTFDTNKDGIVDLITFKEKNNLIPYNYTPLQATIYYLKNSLKTAKQINNPNFVKEMFINNLEEIINSLERINEK